MLLGVVLGIFILPGVLDSYLAGEEVDAGATYTGNARVISVASVESGPQVLLLEDGSRASGTRVELNVLSRKTWILERAFFQLELNARGDWVEASEPAPSIPDSSLNMPLDEQRILVLQFATT